MVFIIFTLILDIVKWLQTFRLNKSVKIIIIVDCK